MFELLKKEAFKKLKNQHFDCLAVGVLDFLKNDFSYFELSPQNNNIYFDLASLTKPFTLSTLYLKQRDLFSDKRMLWLLNHRAGLPAWGKLSKNGYKEQIEAYLIKESPTLYSDFGALRLMLEFEQKSDITLDAFLKEELKELVFWKDLCRITDKFCPMTGTRHNQPIQGEVNDDNAYVLDRFCSHAGLFGSIQGVCKTLLALNNNFNLLEVIKNEYLKLGRNGDRRYVCGLDQNKDENLGHLGFTGTSFWIDIKKKFGHVILSNATKLYWHDRTGLNDLRAFIGEKVKENNGYR